jgi:hypothetical protein
LRSMHGISNLAAAAFRCSTTGQSRREQVHATSSCRVKTAGIPTGVHRASLERDPIDNTHSHAYTAWRNMGRLRLQPQRNTLNCRMPAPLQLLCSRVWLGVRDG